MLSVPGFCKSNMRDRPLQAPLRLTPIVSVLSSLTDYPQVDVPGSQYKPVNFCAEHCPRPPKWWVRMSLWGRDLKVGRETSKVLGLCKSNMRHRPLQAPPRGLDGLVRERECV